MAALNSFWSSKFGATGIYTFTTGLGAALAMIPGTPPGSTSFLLYASQDVYLRQGPAGIAATTADFLLKAGTPWPILIESILDNFISARGVNAAGTLKITNTTDLHITPNTGP